MSDETTSRARDLRRTGSLAERKRICWDLLRGLKLHGLKFRHQHPIGPYFADFARVSRKLVIEIDGGHHAFQVEADQRRTYPIASQWGPLLSPAIAAERTIIGVVFLLSATAGRFAEEKWRARERLRASSSPRPYAGRKMVRHSAGFSVSSSAVRTLPLVSGPISTKMTTRIRKKIVLTSMGMAKPRPSSMAK
jgi:uncharacterized protein DUF559